MTEKEVIKNKELNEALNVLRNFAHILNDGYQQTEKTENNLDFANPTVQKIFCDSFLNRKNKEDYLDSYFFEILANYIFSLLKKDFPNAELLSGHRYLCIDGSTSPREVFSLLSTKEQFLKIRELVAKCKLSRRQFNNLISLVCSNFHKVENEKKYDGLNYPSSIEIEYFCAPENYEWPRSRSLENLDENILDDRYTEERPATVSPMFDLSKQEDREKAKFYLDEKNFQILYKKKKQIQLDLVNWFNKIYTDDSDKNFSEYKSFLKEIKVNEKFMNDLYHECFQHESLSYNDFIELVIGSDYILDEINEYNYKLVKHFNDSSFSENIKQPSFIDKIKFLLFRAKINLNILLDKHSSFKDDYRSGDDASFTKIDNYKLLRDYIHSSKKIPFSKTFQYDLIKYRYFLSSKNHQLLNEKQLIKYGEKIKNELISRFNKSGLSLKKFESMLSSRLEVKNFRGFYRAVKVLIDLG